MSPLPYLHPDHPELDKLNARTQLVLTCPEFPVRDISCDPDKEGIFFTGWKSTDPFAPSLEYVGQFVKVIRYAEGEGSEFLCAYVNLPGMEKGVAPEGGMLDIGTARLKLDEQSSNQLVSLLVEGAKLMDSYLQILSQTGYLIV